MVLTLFGLVREANSTAFFLAGVGEFQCGITSNVVGHVFPQNDVSCPPNGPRPIKVHSHFRLGKSGNFLRFLTFDFGLPFWLAKPS